MNNNIGCGIPAGYDYINLANAAVSPSTVHVKNTALYNFFARYLLQKVFAVFDWKMPKTWAKDYLLYVLYGWGFISIVNTDKFGVIPQACSLRGYDVFYRPTHAVITNPLLNGILQPKIGTECTVLKLMPDYGGIMDLVSYYAEQMALSAECLAVDLFNLKLAYVFRASNKAQAESFKSMYDSIASGQPAVFIDKTLLDDSEMERWGTFSHNLKESYIVGDLLTDMRKIEAEFDTKVGIPNANTDKRERLITAEVNANNFETQALADLWLSNLQDGCKAASEMFGIKLSVDFRESLKAEREVAINGNA